MRRSRRHASLLVGGSLLAVCLWFGAAAWAVGSVSLQPSSGSPGSGFDVVMTGFAPGEKVQDITWDGTVLASDLTIPPSGNLTVGLTVPSSASSGVHTVTVKARGRVSATFVVVPPPTTSSTTTSTSSTTTTSTTTATSTTTSTTSPPTSTSTRAPGSVTTSVGGPGATDATTPVASSEGETPTTAVGAAPTNTNAGQNGGTSAAGDVTTTTAHSGFVAAGSGAWVWPFVVAGLLAAVVAGLVVFGRRKTPAPVVSETKPSFETYASPKPISSSWVVTPLQFEPGVRLERIKHEAGFYYACGMSSVAGLTPARVWRSENGIEWFPLGTMEPGLVTDVAFVPAPMAFGHVVGLQAQPVAACWLYKDDESGWTRITGLHAAELDGVLFEQAELAPDGFVAAARARAGTGLYLSSNGAMWNPSRFPIAVEAIQRVGPNLVVFGRHRDDRRIEILESPDGVDWTSWAEPLTLPFEMSLVEYVVGLQGGFVAGGADRLRHTGSLWVSDDGRIWHRVSVEFPAESHVAWLGVVEDQPYAVIETLPTGGTPTLELWRSPDAVEWQAVENARIDGALYLGAVLKAGQIEVFGRTSAGGGADSMRRWSIEVSAASEVVTPTARR